MISFPTKQDLTELLQQERGPCASILMRTHPSGRETTQNPIRFRNLITKLIDEAKRMKCPLKSQLVSFAELEHNIDFWQHQAAGLAIYLCEGFEQRFSLSHAPEDSTHLGDHFNIRPIASIACGDTDVRSLAISWERTRLFSSDGHTTVEVIDDTFPVTMEELVAERDPEKHLQYTSHRQSGNPGEGTAMYHGQCQGEGKIHADRNLYLSRVGEMIGKRMYGADQILIVVATEEVAGHFDAAAESINVAEIIHASPDGLDDQALMNRITVAAHEQNEHTDAAITERIGTALANKSASTKLVEIILAAFDGRVETLLLGCDQPIIGDFDSANRKVTMSSESNTDLLNVAVRQTLEARGNVRRLRNAAEDRPFSAIFRY